MRECVSGTEAEIVVIQNKMVGVVVCCIPALATPLQIAALTVRYLQSGHSAVVFSLRVRRGGLAMTCRIVTNSFHTKPYSRQ